MRDTQTVQAHKCRDAEQRCADGAQSERRGWGQLPRNGRLHAPEDGPDARTASAKCSGREPSGWQCDRGGRWCGCVEAKLAWGREGATAHGGRRRAQARTLSEQPGGPAAPTRVATRLSIHVLKEETQWIGSVEEEEATAGLEKVYVRSVLRLGGVCRSEEFACDGVDFDVNLVRPKLGACGRTSAQVAEGVKGNLHSTSSDQVRFQHRRQQLPSVVHLRLQAKQGSAQACGIAATWAGEGRPRTLVTCR